MSDDDHRQLLGQWFEVYHLDVYRYLLRLIGDEQLAADVLQDTFLRALRALQRTAPPDNPPAWLHRIATNLARSALRRRARWSWLRLTGREAIPGGAQSAVTADLIRRGLLHLRPAEAEALLLYEWVGLSCAEIASLTRAQPATVRMRLSRARARLARWYEQEACDEL